MKKKVKVFFLSEFFFGVVANIIAVILFCVIVSVKLGETSADYILKHVFRIIYENVSHPLLSQLLLLTNGLVLFISIYIAFFYESNTKILKTGMTRVTDQISIPVSAGSSQYGTSRFMTLSELDHLSEVGCLKYDGHKMPQKGGIVIGIRAMGSLPDKGSTEKILYIKEDRHALLVGATRSGKSRRSILESIWLTLLAGENIVVTDPKGELCAYTSPFAENLGYQKVVIDFRDPNKGNRHNFMQEILDALENNNTAEAIDLTWDLVSVLVGEAKGEPIWHNGECAAIAATILIVAIEAPKEYRNLTNVYYFLYRMATPDEFGEMPITRYLDALPETHPARAVFAMAAIAHTKTRGSFFSSALGTLRHFTNPNIADMTASTDYSYEQMAHKKTIVYIILPDEKTTLYGLGSLYITQHYIYNVKCANQNGGRVPIDWWYFLDEFGNLPTIPPMPQFLSVGAGRGMRFLLAVQDFQQIQKKYRDDYNTIKNNCDAWIYLKCSNEETLKEFSERVGNYTVQVNSTNFSEKKASNSGSSYGSSLTGRALLLPEEVGLIDSPFCLISMAGKMPIMLITPDLSYYRANAELGLGDKEHNKQVIASWNQQRVSRVVGDIKLWGVWNEYEVMDEYSMDDGYGGLENEEEYEEKVSFLD